ncbi:hypothetical protein L0F63_003790 [Massospora cicadina]|nr:hypothetical protein L0F63_003790 [Massospora cicadina]
MVPSREDVLMISKVWKHMRKPPAKLRKDQWKPILAAKGFPSETTADIVWQSLVTFPAAVQDQEFKSKPTTKFCALCRILQDLPNYLDDQRVFPVKPESPLSLELLWETPYYSKLVDKENLEWPEFVKHGVLDLLRGRHIMNEEYRKTPTAGERAAKIREMSRLEYEKKMMRERQIEPEEEL